MAARTFRVARGGDCNLLAPTNRGFPAAINQGLQFARGEYLVQLNNDVVVADGWLDQLVALISTTESENDSPKSKIQLVGPMSNYAAPPQLVEDVPYHDLDDMKVFAQRWRDEHRGKWFYRLLLSGFCLLMTRAVYDSVGGLDERFGSGFLMMMTLLNWKRWARV